MKPSTDLSPKQTNVTEPHECKCGGNCSNIQVTAPDLSRDNVIVEIFRNRSVMEANVILKDTGEIIDRLPVDWKARENKLDYLSVSKIQAYEQCPACFYRQYMSEESVSVDNSNYFTKFGTIMHDVAEQVVKIWIENGIKVDPAMIFDQVWASYELQGFDDFINAKQLIINYFNNNPVDTRPDTPVIVEKEWRGQLGGFEFGLILDYAGVYKKNGKIGLLRDYKTNRMPFTTAELNSSLQLKIYEIVLRRHLMPEVEEWRSGYDLFFHGWQQCPVRSADDLLRAEEYVSVIGNQIKNDNKWEERLNTYCGYRECRHTCKTYQDMISREYNDLNPIVKYDGIDLEKLNSDREKFTALEKSFKLRKEECQNILKAEIEECSKRGEKLILGGSELSLFAGSTSSYRFNDVNRVLEVNNRLDLLDGCLSITKSKFDEKLSGADAGLRLQLSGCMSSGYSSPYITSKRV